MMLQVGVMAATSAAGKIYDSCSRRRQEPNTPGKQNGENDQSAQESLGVNPSSTRKCPKIITHNVFRQTPLHIPQTAERIYSVDGNEVQREWTETLEAYRASKSPNTTNSVKEDGDVEAFTLIKTMEIF